MPKTILAVDDSSSVRQMMSQTLEKAGYKVVQAENGRDALERIGAQPVEMMITDLNMPELDGIGLIREVRQDSSRRFMPIVMLTSESEESKRLEGKEAGASAWLTKPFRPQQLVKLVQMVLG